MKITSMIAQDKNIISILEETKNSITIEKLPIANISFVEVINNDEILIQLQNKTIINVTYNNVDERNEDFRELADALNNYYKRKNII
jgi:hypothetical protein